MICRLARSFPGWLLTALLVLAAGNTQAEDQPGLVLGAIAAVDTRDRIITVNQRAFHAPRAMDLHSIGGHHLELSDLRPGMWVRFRPVHTPEGRPVMTDFVVLSAPPPEERR